MRKEIKDLGYMNGWLTKPKEIAECKCKFEPKGKISRTIGTGLTEIICKKCCYSYKIDSSG